MVSRDSQEGDRSDSGQGLFSGIKSALGFGSARDRHMSDEEIMTLVDANDELLPDEKRMIAEVLELDDLTVSDVMQPRVDIIAVEDDMTVRQALERMKGTGYSRLPVFHEDLDHITGIVHFKDLIQSALDGTLDVDVAPLSHDALFVPETKDLLPLLSEMQTNRQQMAIVVDEYGGTDGLITIEDIVEEIVGEIIDETDAENSFIVQVSDSEWTVDGRCPIEEAQQMGLPVRASDEYETIAGWLLDEVDAVPRLGDEFVIEGYRFKVLSMRRRRIRQLRVSQVKDPCDC